MQMTGEEEGCYLDVMDPVQQGDLVAGGLYLASNALIFSKKGGVALHV